MTSDRAKPTTPLHEIFAGDRGRLLVGLLFAEFGTAVQAVAESAVLPLAAKELDGAALFGPTVAAPTLAAIVFVLAGPTVTGRFGPRGAVGISTLVYVVSVLTAVLAPTMLAVLVGRLLQGAAIGILSGFGLSAIGTLYHDAIRPRVLALFAVSWLLPSVLGPAINALVATFAGWRWAMGWPALVVVSARILIGRRAALIPRPESLPPMPLLTGLAVLAGLVLATAAPALAGPVRGIAWAGGLALAAVAGTSIIRRLTVDRSRFAAVAVLTGLIVAFFAGEGLLALGVIEVTGAGVAWAGIAYAAAGVTWSLLGLRPAEGRLRAIAGPVGAVGLVAALGAEAAVTLPSFGPWAIGVVVPAWAVAGAALGIAYPVFTSRPFDGLDPQRVVGVSAAVAFAETAGIAVASLLGSGFYSITADALPIATSVGVGYLIAAVAAAGTLVLATASRSLRR